MRRNTYEQFLAARSRMEQKAGQFLVEMFELNGDVLPDMFKDSMPNSDARSLIFFSKVSKRRKALALKAYNEYLSA